MPGDAGIATQQGLNGAQVRAVLDVLAQLGTGQIEAAVAVEVLAATGIERSIATQMVKDST